MCPSLCSRLHTYITVYPPAQTGMVYCNSGHTSVLELTFSQRNGLHLLVGIAYMYDPPIHAHCPHNGIGWCCACRSCCAGESSARGATTRPRTRTRMTMRSRSPMTHISKPLPCDAVATECPCSESCPHAAIDLDLHASWPGATCCARRACVYNSSARAPAIVPHTLCARPLL